MPILTGFGYGIEFSPSGKYLYTSTAFDGEIAQYDLTSDDLKASKTVLREADSKSIGALQIAPDGKIYYQIDCDEDLGSSSKPESKGEAALLSDEAILLPGKIGRFGLPTFMQTFFTEENIEKNLNEHPITEIPEAEILDAVTFGHEAIKQLISFQEEIISLGAKEKREFIAPEFPEGLEEKTFESAE